MKHPKDLSILDFTYDLPAEKIAQYPLAQRDGSKLLLYKNENISESTYAHLDAYIPASSLLIFNNTKVVEARLLFQKNTGSTIELFCLEPADNYPDITTAMLQKGKVNWKCLVGGAKKWKNPSTEPLVKELHTSNGVIQLQALILEKRNDYFLIELSWNADLAFAEVLHAAGVIPLPPYMNRTAEQSDKERYQTIYAKHDGSVAAPTAGLHFTEALFEKLTAKNIDRDFVTLHVGAGTFKPVKSATMEEHEMHAEFIDVRVAAIQNIIAHMEKGVFAVGTTSLRTIESLFWLGVKTILQPTITHDDLHITQWEPYELDTANISAADALSSLLEWMQQHNTDRLLTKTQIIIAPGYTLRVAKGLITNFHQPQSTLLLLVAAITGDNWKRIYDYALTHDFRFLSYGDGCFLQA
ncbi:MAG: S-adenosylmethionine:tRNA ribosyltransferase-isomerase [Filimonas sp.]|nr:S-adenosylmethionine:tRNA ribosyltransferase-isomerase [Filimonas sp.]